MSTARQPFSPLELNELLEKSRRNNAATGVTGLLLYRDEHFLQAIEGEQEVVERLFQRIGADPRHSHVTVMFREPIATRDFSEWSMGFRDIRLLGLEGPEGFNDLLNTPWANREIFPPKVKAFMRFFVRA